MAPSRTPTWCVRSSDSQDDDGAGSIAERVAMALGPRRELDLLGALHPEHQPARSHQRSTTLEPLRQREGGARDGDVIVAAGVLLEPLGECLEIRTEQTTDVLEEGV